MPLADTGAFLSMLDGPQGCDPAFQVIRASIRMIRRCHAFRPEEIRRIFKMIDCVAEGCARTAWIYSFGQKRSKSDLMDLGCWSPSKEKPSWDIFASQQLLRDERLVRGILSGWSVERMFTRPSSKRSRSLLVLWWAVWR